jgi:hypothetical protein
MLLAIHTQNKNKLIPYNQTISIVEERKRYVMKHGLEVLGKYNSRERALEILEEIKIRLCMIHQFTNENNQIVMAFASCGEVYEMPKE